MLRERLLSQKKILSADSRDDLLQYLCRGNEYFSLEFEPESDGLSLGTHLKNLVVEIGQP